MGQVILRAFHLDRACRPISEMTCVDTPICRCWCTFGPQRSLRFRSACRLGEANNPEWKTEAFGADCALVLPRGSTSAPAPLRFRPGFDMRC
jgi:nitrate reductase / nitrite oxidoreductase, alpha subunit